MPEQIISEYSFVYFVCMIFCFALEDAIAFVVSKYISMLSPPPSSFFETRRSALLCVGESASKVNKTIQILSKLFRKMHIPAGTACPLSVLSFNSQRAQHFVCSLQPSETSANNVFFGVLVCFQSFTILHLQIFFGICVTCQNYKRKSMQATVVIHFIASSATVVMFRNWMCLSGEIIATIPNQMSSIVEYAVIVRYSIIFHVAYGIELWLFACMCRTHLPHYDDEKW